MSFMKKDSNADLEKAKTPSSAWSVFISREGLIFQLAVILTSAVSVLILREANSITLEMRLNILTAGVSISFIMWLALSYSLWLNVIDNFFKNFGYFFIIVGPVGLLTILANNQPSELFFWWNLVVWSCVTIKFSISEEIHVNYWEKNLLTLSVIWAVTSAMVTLGSLPWVPFSERATQRLTALSFFVDLRLLLGILLLITATGTSIFRALIQESPLLKELEPWSLPIPEINSFFLSLIPPIIHVINVLLVVLHGIVELLWKSLQLLVILFGRIGVQLAKLMKKIATQYPTWINTGRSIFSLSLLVLSFYFIKITAPHLYSYLSTSIWKEQLRQLLPILFSSFIVLLCVWVVTSMINQVNIKSVGDATIRSLGWLLMVYLLGGALVYGYCCFGITVNGYEKIGLFSIFLVLLIITGVVYALYNMRNKNNQIA